MNRLDATGTGYQMDKVWCLRCDVGWPRRLSAPTVCWMCDKSDEVYTWKFLGVAPGLYPIEENPI